MRRTLGGCHQRSPVIGDILPRMRRLFVTAMVLVCAIVLAVGLWATIGSSNHYHLGSASFTATFPSSPSLTTAANPDWGLGGFPSSSFKETATWRAGTSSVVVAKLNVTKEQLVTDLRSSAMIWKGSLKNNNGTWILTFTSHVKHGGSHVEPWYHALIEVRGSDFFYALGSGRSLRLASEFVPTFRVLSV